MAANDKIEPTSLDHERKEAARLYHEKQAKKRANQKALIAKEWYERSGDKIIKKTRMKHIEAKNGEDGQNANTHTVFVGNIKKMKKAGIAIPKYTYSDENEAS